MSGKRKKESVWEYPRPPRLEAVDLPLQVVFGGETIAETRRGYRVLETSHPPTYYLPKADCRTDLLTPTSRHSICEWKGAARYCSITVGEETAENAAWEYLTPTGAFSALRDHLAFYAAALDACFVDGEKVNAQEGGFYGGWVTTWITGPFKGGPGTMGW